MDAEKRVRIGKLVAIGLFGGMVVPLVKLVHAGFRLGPAATAAGVREALFTYLACWLLGAIVVAFIVDRDARRR